MIQLLHVPKIIFGALFLLYDLYAQVGELFFAMKTSKDLKDD